MRDIVVVTLLLVSFAFVVTVHVAIALGLAKRRRWQALVALVLPPVAPYLAWREHMRKRAILWALGVLSYGVMLLLASRES